jgi:O-methyltransferase
MATNFLLGAARSVLETRLIRRIVEGLDLHSDNRMRERGMLAQAFEFTKMNGVSGDYFEFGLYDGRTFIYAHQMKHRYRCADMILWGFDSFQGLPQIDDVRDNTWSDGQYACSETDLRKILRSEGLRDQEYRLVPGYYEYSLNNELHDKLAGRRAAIVYIDCDLYTSAKLVLDFLPRYLVDGTIVCFDDFYCYKGSPDQGEQRALSEFLAGNNHIRFLPWSDYSPVGKSFIVRVGQ